VLLNRGGVNEILILMNIMAFLAFASGG